MAYDPSVREDADTSPAKTLGRTMKNARGPEDE